MTIYLVEVDGDWTDYGDCFFKVIARNKKEAYAKANEIDGRHIVCLREIKYLG